jgi:hypothetical protein
VNSKTTTLSAAFVSAVALASGAYALGTQSDDGSAAASRDRAAAPMGYGAPPPPGAGRRFDRHGPDRMAGFDDLAKKLGVSSDKLKTAFKEIRKEQRDDLVAKLAKKLGVPESRVKAALPDRPKAFRFHRGPGGPGGPGRPAGPPPGAPPGP